MKVTVTPETFTFVEFDPEHTIIRPVPSGLRPYRPLIRTASSLNQRRNSDP